MSSDMPSGGHAYKGDISPLEAWEVLKGDPHACLVDVRTQAEWDYVGIPDLKSLGGEVVFVPWQVYPAMVVNVNFAEMLAGIVPRSETPLLFICRSGVRSRFSAAAMTAQGYSDCYNIAGGFEGDGNDDKHRGFVSGWKVDGLPWVQG